MMRVLGVGTCSSLADVFCRECFMSRPAVADRDRLLATARELDELVRELKDVVARLVVAAHDRGATWDEIGTTVGVTRQAVHERFGPNSRALRRGDQRRRSAGHR
jgi:hypothetical protein